VLIRSVAISRYLVNIYGQQIIANVQLVVSMKFGSRVEPSTQMQCGGTRRLLTSSLQTQPEAEIAVYTVDLDYVQPQ